MTTENYSIFILGLRLSQLLGVKLELALSQLIEVKLELAS